MRPYSKDLRKRAVQRAETGETIRSIAGGLQISPASRSRARMPFSTSRRLLSSIRRATSSAR